MSESESIEFVDYQGSEVEEVTEDPRKVEFIMTDLDGTVREPLSGENFMMGPGDQKLTLAAAYISEVSHKLGVTVVGITNQGGVKAGYKTFRECVEEQGITLQLCPWMKYILFCPDNGETAYKVSRKRALTLFGRYFAYAVKVEKLRRFPGAWRKPDIGMLQYAIEQEKSYNWIYKMGSKCTYFGDRDEDRSAANSMGVTYVHPRDIYKWYPQMVYKDPR